jgi:hypothetical protein
MSQFQLATYPLCHKTELRHTPYVTRPNCDIPLSQILQFFCPYYMSQVGLVTYLFIYFFIFSINLIELVLKNVKK